MHVYAGQRGVRNRFILTAAALSLPVAAACAEGAGPAVLPPAPTPQLLAIQAGAPGTGAAPSGAAPLLPVQTDSTGPSSRAENSPAPSQPLTMFPHSLTAPWFLAGQTNIIFQTHASFESPYEGTNSFLSRGEYKTSLLGTFFSGYQPLRGLHGEQTEKNLRYNTDLIFDLESAGGRGLSEALGIAGFPNLDVVRNPNLSSVPYVARAEIHQTIGLTDEMTDAARTPLSLATKVPVRRFDFRFGKMSLPDIFDLNTVLSDSHLQFMDWTVDNNGAWDYAADTRGYTYAATLEYTDHNWTLRYGLGLMPTVANGIDLDWNLHRARAFNMEAEWRHSFFGHPGVQRVLAYVNNAHMGDYKSAINGYLDGEDKTPNITAHETFDNQKIGFGYNFEQQMTQYLNVGGRFGWSDDGEESYAYTEVGQTILFGGSYVGKQWGRPNDKFGMAFNTNAIKRYHQQYLALGGLGFLLGDGHLSYGREDIVESYYNIHAWRGMFFGFGETHIDHPGYNTARGPVWVESVRSHIDF